MRNGAWWKANGERNAYACAWRVEVSQLAPPACGEMSLWRWSWRCRHGDAIPSRPRGSSPDYVQRIVCIILGAKCEQTSEKQRKNQRSVHDAQKKQHGVGWRRNQSRWGDGAGLRGDDATVLKPCGGLVGRRRSRRESESHKSATKKREATPLHPGWSLTVGP